MKIYRIHKQLIPDTNKNNEGWAQRQIWVYKLNGEDTVDEFDNLNDALLKRDELDSNDPTDRIYRVVEVIDKFSYKVIT